jgi:predicted ester cyclase
MAEFEAAWGTVDGVDPEVVLQRIFEEIVNQGRIDAADELFAEDYVDHGPMGDLEGREAFKAVVSQWRAAVPDVQCSIENVIVRGDMAAWLVRTTGTHTGGDLGFPPTGRTFETVSANLGRLRDGRAVEHWSEQGMLPMLLQLGLLPSPLG